MRKACVCITGVAPLLMNRFAWEDQNEDTVAKRKDVKYDPETDAKKASYFDDKIGMYIPSTHIEGALKKAATEYKQKGQKTYKECMQSSVFVEEDKLPLGRKDWDEIDRSPVKVQTARVVRSRPRFNKWSLNFTLSFDETRISGDVLKQILEEAGATKGVGDWRPKHGRFKVEKFEVK